MLLDREPLSLHCALSTAKVNGVEVVSCVICLKAAKAGGCGRCLRLGKEVTRENLYLRNSSDNYWSRRSIRPRHVSRFGVRVFDFRRESDSVRREEKQHDWFAIEV